jgi:hypothetical protein
MRNQSRSNRPRHREIGRDAEAIPRTDNSYREPSYIYDHSFWNAFHHFRIDLSKLDLLYMSDLSYIEAMVTALSALLRPTDLSIDFGISGTIRRPPPPTPAVLPLFQSSGAKSDSEKSMSRNSKLSSLCTKSSPPLTSDKLSLTHARALSLCQAVIYVS